MILESSDAFVGETRICEYFRFVDANAAVILELLCFDVALA